MRGLTPLKMITPMVSCIMPTADRRQFVPSAIRFFLSQQYPNKELIILDDGDDPIGDLVPEMSEIRYLKIPKKEVLGLKRNQLCELAQGEIIAHWDDDDWQAPHRLTEQVRALLDADAEICGTTRPIFFDPNRNQAWQYVYPPGSPPWLSGNSLCYRRGYWQRHAFADLNVGEDARFVASGKGKGLLDLGECDFHVGIIHSANISPKRTSSPRWQSYDAGKINSLMGSKIEPLPNISNPVVKSPYRTALVAAAYGIGDILRATPLIKALNKLGYQVDFLVAPDHAETLSLFNDSTSIASTIHYPDLRTNNGAEPIPEIKNQSYDVAFFSYWAHPLQKHVRAKQTLSMEREEWLKLGDSECCRLLARKLGWSDPLPSAFATHSGRRFNLPTGTIALHPGCKKDWPWKKWHGFAELASRLDSVVVVGTPADIDNSQTYFRDKLKWPNHVQNFIGKLSLDDTAALLSQCRALVSNDSGIMQLGTALGVPTLGIFGITNPDRECMPQPNIHPVTKGLPCEAGCRQEPWGRRDCVHHLECLKSLTADDVILKLQSVSSAPRPVEASPVGPVVDQISVTYYANVFDATGYGRAARAYIHALHVVGVRLAVVDVSNRPQQVEDKLVESLLGLQEDADFHLYHGIPSEWAHQVFKQRNTIAMTVWETNTLPNQWRNALNHALDVWVPSRFNEVVFTGALETPVFRLPHPVHWNHKGSKLSTIETDQWLGIKSTDFVFYSIFEWQDRKNPHGMIEAFLREFGGEPKAVLLLKTNPGADAVANQLLKDQRRRLKSQARVILRCEAWTDEQILALHCRGNCYVSLHFGEGWGYPLFDAASRGTPVVATRYSGPLDYLGGDYPGNVGYDLCQVQQPYTFYNGLMQWAKPRLAEASSRLRWVYDNYQKATDHAEGTKQEILRDYTIEAIGKAAKFRLLDLLAKHQPRRGLRLKLTEQSSGLKPSLPIAGHWYDEDYFERGIKSNWKDGYNWDLFGDLFGATATFLSETFPEATSFLDAGCAKGFLVRALRQLEKECWGVDHSKWAIDHADEFAKPFLQRCRVEDYLPDGQYDVLTALHLMESLTEDQAFYFLSLARTWTKQAAFFVISTSDFPPMENEKYDWDLSRVSLHPRTWWHELFLKAGWHQDSLHRVAQMACDNHPLPSQMGWHVFLYSPGHE